MGDQVVFHQDLIGAGCHNAVACDGVQHVVADDHILRAQRDAILHIPGVPAPRTGARVAAAGDTVAGDVLNQAVLDGQAVDVGLTICTKGNGRAIVVVGLGVPTVDVMDVEACLLYTSCRFGVPRYDRLPSRRGRLLQ